MLDGDGGAYRQAADHLHRPQVSPRGARRRVHRLLISGSARSPRTEVGYRTARDWAFWQFTTTGSVPGVAGRVDRNSFNGTEAQYAGWVRGEFDIGTRRWDKADKVPPQPDPGPERPAMPGPAPTPAPIPENMPVALYPRRRSPRRLWPFSRAALQLQPCRTRTSTISGPAPRLTKADKPGAFARNLTGY